MRGHAVRPLTLHVPALHTADGGGQTSRHPPFRACLPPLPQTAYFWWGAGSLGAVVALPLLSCALSCVCSAAAACRNNGCGLACCCDGGCGSAARVVPLTPREDMEAEWSWLHQQEQWELAQRCSSMSAAGPVPPLHLLPTWRPTLQVIHAAPPQAPGLACCADGGDDDGDGWT